MPSASLPSWVLAAVFAAASQWAVGKNARAVPVRRTSSSTHGKLRTDDSAFWRRTEIWVQLCPNKRTSDGRRNGQKRTDYQGIRGLQCAPRLTLWGPSRRCATLSSSHGRSRSACSLPSQSCQRVMTELLSVWAPWDAVYDFTGSQTTVFSTTAKT